MVTGCDSGVRGVTIIDRCLLMADIDQERAYERCTSNRASELFSVGVVF